MSWAENADRQPKAEDLANHIFPALGSPAARRVPVEWNRFYDHAGLGAILARLHQAFPHLTELYSVGKSYEGRDLWCLEVTAKTVRDPKRKPGMYIDGNIHGNEVQGGEVVAYTAWYLCHQYGRLEKVTELLDHNVFYLIPTINPDGRDRWFHHAQTANSSRSGLRPYDNDRDGLVDEDDVDDLDRDGSITQMRVKDPNGRWKVHPQFPEHLVQMAAPDEKGEYTLLGLEGIDNDGDGQINEDGAGGYDTNRNWAWDWQPNYIQFGAQEYPFSLSESRAIADFVTSHPNIAAFQSYHNAGGMILRNPGREGGVSQPEDERTLQFIAQRGEKMLPFYRSMIVWKDLYTVWGGEVDWFYGARGILGFTTELWTQRNLDRSGGASREDEAAFLKYVLLNDGVVKWHEFDHPTFGKIEIGGTKKEWGRTPVSFLLEEECHRNMAFTLYHADQMPRLSISEVEVRKIDDDLFRIWVTIENSRLIPTRTSQDVRNHIGPPDVVTLSGANVNVLSSGVVTDRFFKRVEATKRRPERVELDSVRGMSAARVQFIVRGRGNFAIRADSAKGGQFSTERALR
ncbi:MAG: peptidase M14 [Verrucomicrobia bacterium]|nr:peptidase M14 [Verrucomicrobiota bacterium]